MSNPTIAIRQADGTFYPIMTGGKAGKKRLILTPAQDSQSGAKIELVRGFGEEMEDPRTFGTLHVDVTSQPEGEIELILAVDENLNITASAGLLGSPDRQELQGNLEDLLDQPSVDTSGLDDMELPSLDDLDSPEEAAGDSFSGNDPEEGEPFEFDAEEPAQPKTDRQILDDDSLVGDGLDDLSFGIEDEIPAEGGPVEGADLGDLGDLGSFDDFGTSEDFSADPLSADEGGEPDAAGPGDVESEDFTLPEDSGSLFDEDLQEDDSGLPEDFRTDDSAQADSLDFSMDDLSQEEGLNLEGFDEVEDLAPVQESPLASGRKTFEKGPEGFGLDVSVGHEEDDLSFDSMEMDSLGDLGSDLDFDSPAGDLSPGDFSLDAEISPSESDDFVIPEAPQESYPQETRIPEGNKSAPRETNPSARAKVSGKVPLVVSLGTLVVLLGIFLGLLFLNMTRMTMVPPIQSLDLRDVPEVAAYRSQPLPGDRPLPGGRDEESRRILSLEYYGTPHFYRQFPLAN